MPVTITSKTPANNSVQIGWNSNPPANVSANVYVSPTQSDLANPPTFPASVIAVPADQTGQLPGVTDFTATISGLSSGTLYYVLCEADGVYSAYPDSFTTTGAAPGPPIAIPVQDNSVTLPSVSPLTLRFDWVGPDSVKGQVSLGTAPGSLTVAGQDPNPGARHTYSINSGLAFNTTYYYQLAGLDGTGSVVSQSPVLAAVTPKSPTNNMFLATPAPTPSWPFPPFPPHPVVPFVTNPHIHPGGRSVITVDTKDGTARATNVLVEFKLADPAMGKLGHGNLIGGDVVQILADSHMFETVVFVSSGKVGTATIGIRVVGSHHTHAAAKAVITVS